MKRVLIGAGALAAVALLLVAANFHIVTGSTVSGVTFQKKMSMSLSETFVNLDSVGNMPMIVARAQYPMFVASLEHSLAEAQAACGAELQEGMTREVVIARCGQPKGIEPGDFELEKMWWRTGLVVHVQRGLVTYITGR